jgi:hypothetical protein
MYNRMFYIILGILERELHTLLNFAYLLYYTVVCWDLSKQLTLL